MKAITENSKTIVFYEDDLIQGKLLYKNRFSAQATMQDSENRNYEIKPLNFLKYKYNVFSEDKILLTLKKRWRGNFIIQTFFNSGNEEYNFKHKGLFRGRYILLDKDDRELASVRLKFIWKSLKYEYNIAVSDGLNRRPQKLLLIMIMTYMARITSKQKRAGSL